MKIIRKNFTLLLLVTLFALIIVFIGIYGNTAYAGTITFDGNSHELEKLTNELFGDVRIRSTEYLYNFDDSPDFIYLDFENYGYAVFMRETLELLEYAAQGSLPYQNSREKKYYSGPKNYFNKIDRNFVNAVTSESFFLSNSAAKGYSQELRRVFSASENANRELVGNYISPKNVPSIDTGALITPNNINATYIPNAQYFLTNPTHGINTTGTCGAVAAQLLLSYNNYYNDRRIIEDQHLNGWDFNTNTVINIEENPNHCIDPMSMTDETLGSNGVIETDADSYFAHVINSIPTGATVSQAKNGLENILGGRLPNNGFVINSASTPFGWWAIGSSNVEGT